MARQSVAAAVLPVDSALSACTRQHAQACKQDYEQFASKTRVVLVMSWHVTQRPERILQLCAQTRRCNVSSQMVYVS
jgi:hypothetical protein